MLENSEEYLRSNAPNRNQSKSPEVEPFQIEHEPQTPAGVNLAPSHLSLPFLWWKNRLLLLPSLSLQQRHTPKDILTRRLKIKATNLLSHSFQLLLRPPPPWESFNAPEDGHVLNSSELGEAGWELALVSNVSKPAHPNKPTAGGVDHLLLDSLYSQMFCADDRFYDEAGIVDT